MIYDNFAIYRISLKNIKFNKSNKHTKCFKYFTDPKLTNLCEIFLKFQNYTYHMLWWFKIISSYFQCQVNVTWIFSISEYFPLQIINSLHVSVSHSWFDSKERVIEVD